MKLLPVEKVKLVVVTGGRYIPRRRHPTIHKPSGGIRFASQSDHWTNIWGNIFGSMEYQKSLCVWIRKGCWSPRKCESEVGFMRNNEFN